MSDSVYQALEDAILFEDDAIIVINKPPGWVVNRATTYDGLTVQDWMEERIKANPPTPAQTQADPGFAYGTPDEIFAQRGGIVHRLDKDTSGVMILAKTPDALFELLRQFRQRETKKTYLALLHGKLSPSEGSIVLPMDRSSQDFKKFTVSVDGRLSETHYLVKEFFPGLPKGIMPKKGKRYQGFSLVELQPKTGRTHQIRVHMSAVKHPLVGDEVYAGRKRIQVDKEWCPRQFLHALRLEFTHPVTKKPMSVEAPLSNDLQTVINLFSSQS